ncbi:MAG: DUF4115 domain-containing protein [Alphaproteobacteria bacterium]|nr:DUF4115 domain-containing protein [Alphaproteobacteria bacterium]
MSGGMMSTGFVPVDAVFSGDGAETIHMSAGERLRDARQRAGYSLSEAASRTRVRQDYLEALEDMDPRGLPARAYAIGYLRTYATFLGLDGYVIVEQFKREVDTETGRAQPTAAARIRREIKLPRGIVGAVLVLASLTAVAFWYADQAGQSGGLSNLPSPPDAAPEWARADFNAALEPVTVEEIWNGLPLGETQVSSVLMRALAPTWIEVRDASGRVLFARELAAGETYAANENGLTVTARDAGAIEVELDGMNMGVLGETGITLENISLTQLAQAETEPQ